MIFDFLRFVLQVGLVFGGSCAMWGWYFLWKRDLEVARAMRLPLFAGFGIAFLGWAALALLWPDMVFAHEGISLYAKTYFVRWGFELMLPVILLTFLFVSWGAVRWRSGHLRILPTLQWFYALVFFMVVFILVFLTWTKGWDERQIFYSIHNVHSLLTLGTVLVVDYLFLLSLIKRELRTPIFSAFHALSAVIWIGLGLDFLSVYLIFDQMDFSTPQFHFAQTVVSIIILNGALLSGRIADLLQRFNKLSPYVRFLVGFSGSLSVVSWLTITFVDFYEEIPFGFWELMGLYGVAVMGAFIVQQGVEGRLMKQMD